MNEFTMHSNWFVLHTIHPNISTCSTIPQSQDCKWSKWVIAMAKFQRQSSTVTHDNSDLGTIWPDSTNAIRNKITDRLQAHLSAASTGAKSGPFSSLEFHRIPRISVLDSIKFYGFQMLPAFPAPKDVASWSQLSC